MKDKNTQNNRNQKKEDGKFHSKHIKHNPQAESARTVFGYNQSDKNNEQNRH